MSDQQRLSRQLYDVLEDVGASETLRQEHQQSAAVTEMACIIMSKHFSDCDCFTHLCGSQYEGSVTPDLLSDTDIIVHTFDDPVVLDPTSLRDRQSLLMIKEDWSHPGYVKLQIVDNGRPLTAECDRRRIEYTIYDVMGRLCYEQMSEDKMHGPALKHLDSKGKHFLDAVFACKCDHIPDHANEWIFRQRNHDWPTREQIKTMSRMGCMVVRVGHWESFERDIEWRLSFSLQERLLMSSLNSVQHKVYIVLKMIKKDILGRSIEGESASSYHCKTCIFHAVEKTPADFWIPENLIKCILFCLRLLLQWVRDGYCPNYFIKNQNLFSKEGFRRVRDQLRSSLRKLVKKKHHFIYLLECDSIGSLMRGGDVQRIRSATKDKKFEYMLTKKERVMYHIRYMLHFILHDFKDLPYSFSELQSTYSINNNPKHVTQEVINYLQPWLHLHIAKGLAARAIITEDRHSAAMLLRRADEHLSLTSRTDVTSVEFAKASILYSYGKYKECMKLLLEIEKGFTCQRIFNCHCEKLKIFHLKDEQPCRELKEHISQMPVASIMKHHIANCFVLTRSELMITPVALVYEMYRSLGTAPVSTLKHDTIWFDFAVVDPRVYLYFLQYLVYEALHLDVYSQVALENIKAQIEDCNDYRARTGHYKLHHKDTAYNLLGWIYLQQKHVADARHCFTESLNIRPEHNAAKIHIYNIENL